MKSYKNILVIFSLIILGCDKDNNSNITAPPQADGKLVIDSRNISVFSKSVSYNIGYHFEGKPGDWNNFTIEVGGSAHSIAKNYDTQLPTDVNVIKSVSKDFQLYYTLNSGDSVWVNYKFSGGYFDNMNSEVSKTQTYTFKDSVKVFVGI